MPNVVLLVFGIVLAAYLVGLVVFSIIKAILNKRKVKKEFENEEKKQNQDSNS